MLKFVNSYHPNEFQKMLARYVDKAVEIQKGLPVIIERYQKWVCSMANYYLAEVSKNEALQNPSTSIG